MTVVILGGLDDDHAVHMLNYLRERGTDTELLDSRWFPSTLHLACDPVRGSWTLQLPEGRRLDGRQIRSVYWRCYNGIQRPNLPDDEQAFIGGNDARSLFESLLIGLPVKWVNGWQAYQLHQTKPVQLAMVAALGVAVPETLLGNDAESVRAFAARHPRCVVGVLVLLR